MSDPILHPEQSEIVQPLKIGDNWSRGLVSRALDPKDCKAAIQRREGWSKSSFHEFTSRRLDEKSSAEWLDDKKFILFLALTNEWVENKGKKPLLAVDFFPARELSQRDLIRSRVAGEDDSGLGFRSNRTLRDHIAQLRRELSDFEDRRDCTAQRQTLEALATILETAHFWEQASARLEQLAAINKELHDHVGYVNALIRAGTARYRAEQYSEAMKLIEEALEVIHCDARLGLARNRIKAMDYVALIYLRTGRPDDALALFTGPNRQERRRFPTPPLMWASLANRMGLCHLELGNFRRAHKLLCAAHKIRSKFGAKTEEARTLANLALIYFRQGMVGDAMSFRRAYVIFNIALRRQEVVRDIAGQARTQFYLGQCCRLLDDHLTKTAVVTEHHRVAFQIDALLFSERYLSRVLSALTKVHKDTNGIQFKKRNIRKRAAFHYEQSISLASTGAGDASVEMEAKRVLAKLQTNSKPD